LVATELQVKKAVLPTYQAFENDLAASGAKFWCNAGS